MDEKPSNSSSSVFSAATPSDFFESTEHFTGVVSHKTFVKNPSWCKRHLLQVFFDDSIDPGENSNYPSQRIEFRVISQFLDLHDVLNFSRVCRHSNRTTHHFNEFGTKLLKVARITVILGGRAPEGRVEFDLHHDNTRQRTVCLPFSSLSSKVHLKSVQFLNCEVRTSRPHLSIMLSNSPLSASSLRPKTKTACVEYQSMQTIDWILNKTGQLKELKISMCDYSREGARYACLADDALLLLFEGILKHGNCLEKLYLYGTICYTDAILDAWKKTIAELSELSYLRIAGIEREFNSSTRQAGYQLSSLYKYKYVRGNLYFSNGKNPCVKKNEKREVIELGAPEHKTTEIMLSSFLDSSPTLVKAMRIPGMLCSGLNTYVSELEILQSWLNNVTGLEDFGWGYKISGFQSLQNLCWSEFNGIQRLRGRFSEFPLRSFKLFLDSLSQHKLKRVLLPVFDNRFLEIIVEFLHKNTSINEVLLNFNEDTMDIKEAVTQMSNMRRIKHGLWVRY